MTTPFRSSHPRASVSATLAADKSLVSGAARDIMTVSFTPTGAKVVVTATGVYANLNGAVSHSWAMYNGTTTVPLGTFVSPAAQGPFAGQAEFTGLTPGTAYTFTLRVTPNAGTFLCRPVGVTGDEGMTLKAEDAA